MIMTFSDHVLILGCFGYFNLDSHFIHSIYKLANLDLMSNTSKHKRNMSMLCIPVLLTLKTYEQQPAPRVLIDNYRVYQVNWSLFDICL